MALCYFEGSVDCISGDDQKGLLLQHEILTAKSVERSACAERDKQCSSAKGPDVLRGRAKRSVKSREEIELCERICDMIGYTRERAKSWIYVDRSCGVLVLSYMMIRRWWGPGMRRYIPMTKSCSTHAVRTQ